MKKALITGIAGQDGSYLAELLLKKGYEVHGLIKQKNTDLKRLGNLIKNGRPIQPNFFIHVCNLLDKKKLKKIIRNIKPDEIYNLAAQSHVHQSFNKAASTGNITAIGVIHVLDSILENKIKTKLYQASSSEMFGKAIEIPQKETTPLAPSSPYGCAKTYAHWITKTYRETYGLFASTGILYNHESPRREESYVTRKITSGLCRIKKGLQERILLGNLDAKRDWGYAKDYTEGMWRILQQEKPDDFILATGERHSVREFIEECSKILEIDLKWHGKGLKEKGVDKKNGKTIIEIDSKYFRPIETNELIGNWSKAKKKLGWKPKVKFKELIKLMVKEELSNKKN